MTERIMTWHFPTPGAPTPTYYIDADCEPVALRLYATVPPNGGDMIVDILDDGVSIMNTNEDPVLAIALSDATIDYSSQSGTFTEGETVTGGTSGATAVVTENKLGRLKLLSPSVTSFTRAETITGGSSGATATVDSSVREVKKYTRSFKTAQSHAALAKNKKSNEAAQDFRNGAQIAEGSWLSCSILEANGAANVTVQLEVEVLSSSIEKRAWAET